VQDGRIPVGAPGRVLLIDGDLRLEPLVRRSLGGLEYAVDVAGTAVDGIRLAACGGYDVILLELRLPDMDGRGALTHILRGRPGRPVVIVSAIAAARTDHGPMALTRLEFLLLRTLVEHAGRPVPRSELLATVWGMDFDPRTNIIDVSIRRLRAKLGFAVIDTVRGEGYRLACPSRPDVFQPDRSASV